MLDKLSNENKISERRNPKEKKEHNAMKERI